MARLRQHGTQQPVGGKPLESIGAPVYPDPGAIIRQRLAGPGYIS